MKKYPISAVIPTYRREGVLLETIDYLLALEEGPAELLVIDQSELHEPATSRRLAQLDAAGRIRWLRLPTPSIPMAMNTGLLDANAEIVLFLDDDIRPEPDLFSGHWEAHQANPGVLVAGRVIQPWEEGVQAPNDGVFRFSSLEPAWPEEFMGGNFSVARDLALAIGGFDENFVRVAYRFEAEFAHRLRTSGARIRFQPAAALHHLKAEGGTRTFGNYLTTCRPDHAVGSYYHALRTRPGLGAISHFVARPLRSVATRHHLRRPWFIPVTWMAEFRGMIWAVKLAWAGPRYARLK